MAEFTGIFRKPFPEQVAAWRLRLQELRPTSVWTDVSPQFHDRGFMVAGAMKADLLADLAAAVDKAITEGRSLEEFRKDFRAVVARHGWHGWAGEGSKKGEAWRTRVIYRTNLATTYAAGRRAQLAEGKFAFWIYRHGGSREPRPLHLSWNGLTLPPEHPFWQTHSPPNGWGCSCYVGGARTAAIARRMGGDPDKPLPPGWDSIDQKTGAPPGIDKGWAYAPGATVAEDISMLARKVPDLPPELGRDLAETSESVTDRAWPEWIRAVRNGKIQEPGLAGVISSEVSQALTLRGLAPRSAEILVRPGLMVGPEVRRQEPMGDAMTDADWERLPASLRKPLAVLIDRRSGQLLYVLEGDGQGQQLAIDLDYGPLGGHELPSFIVSAYRPRLDDILGRISAALLEVLLGGLG